MIKGLGLYSAHAVEDISTVHSWQEPGDRPVSEALAVMRQTMDLTPEAFAWIGLFEPTRAELDMVGEFFDLPTLQLEDAANPNQRPKVESLPDRAFVLVKVLDYLDSSSDVRTGQLAVFVGPNYAITVRFGQVGDLRPIRTRLESDPSLRAAGPVAVLYGVLDQVVDEYLAVVDEIAVDIEQLEVEVFSNSLQSPSAGRLYRLKRENIEARRAISPLVPWAQTLGRETEPWVPEQLRPYFQDIAEHVMRAYESVESADNLLMSLMMVATAAQDLQQNRDMRKISGWVAIAAVPTMIAGIYGMNFDSMPELHQPWGYPLVLGVMALSCGLIYRAFKKSGWL